MLHLNVTIEKSVMLDNLKKHRDNHITEYEKAVEIYFIQLKERLDLLLNQCVESVNREDNYRVNMNHPVNRVKEYDKYINMLELARETEFELSTSEFDAIINDTWNTDIVQAKMLNSTYLAAID